MLKTRFINRQRLRTYPFLILFTLWAITGANFILRDGWYGGFGGFIGYDFLSYYAGGKLYWTNPGNLYNLAVLADLQSQIVGIPKTGMNYFPYPPFAALFYGFFSSLPYALSFYVWTILSGLCFVAAAILISRYLLPAYLKEWGLTSGYLLVILFSFYPSIFGIQNGQNHAHSFLLVTVIAILSLAKREILTGMAAALLLYKPQLLIGWLVLWLFLGRKRTLVAFAVSGLLVAAPAFFHQGFGPYFAWLNFFRQNTGVYTGAGPWEASAIAFLGRFISMIVDSEIVPLALALLSLAALVTGMLILRRKKPTHAIYTMHALACLAPFLVIPHLMFYDLGLMVIFLAVLSFTCRSRWLLYTAIFAYLGGIFLPVISEASGLPLAGMIPLALLGALVASIFSGQTLQPENVSESKMV